MPELAEVEYYRKQWEPGVGQRVLRVALHGEKRIWRGSDVKAAAQVLTGATVRDSTTRGKQMLFRFTKGGWLGVHLGMTGSLRVEPPDFAPGKHDHLVLYQKKQALVFSDARMFGRLRFHEGKEAPAWWTELPPEVASAEFTLARLNEIFRRRPRAPLKGVLLEQQFFPGVGNWMADEILWQTRTHPRCTAEQLDDTARRALWRTARAVCRTAMKTIGVDWGDPPKGWLLHDRFNTTGRCPRHRTTLIRETIAGRTTAWCEKCQKLPKKGRAKKAT